MPTLDEQFKLWRLSPDYPPWNDFKVFRADSGETLGVTSTRDAEDREQRAFLAGASAEREECANCVPTNWLDGLLSCPDAAIGAPPYTGVDIERLLRAVKERICQRGEEKADD